MIIGISGKARAGKDTFGVMLAEELRKTTGDIYVLTAFARSLKDRCQKDFDLSWDQLWGDEKEIVDERYKKWDDEDHYSYWTPREILQAYGMFFRSINNTFWVDELFNVLDEKEYTNVIITDLRLDNEVEAVRNREGLHIRISRESEGSTISPEHISETALDGIKDIDFTIINNYSLEYLRKTAAETAELISATHKINGGIING